MRRVLRKIPVLGGAPITICELSFGIAGASWGDDGTIVFATPRSGLFRVSADGGEPRQLTKPNDTGDAHLWPEMLPGSETVLFTTDRLGAGGFDVAVLSLETGEQSVLVRGGTSPATFRQDISCTS